MKVLYVVAGNYTEFKLFCARKLGEYNSAGVMTPIFRFVSSTTTLRGLCEVHGWFTGTYEQRSDIEEIKTAIRVINSRISSFKSSTINIVNTPTRCKIAGRAITGVRLDELEANN